MSVRVEPYVLAWPGRKESRWYATIGDNLNDQWWEWNPPIELNCSEIWHKTNGHFEKFVNFLNGCLLHEYPHIEIRLQATRPPGGVASMSLEWKGRREEEGAWRLTLLLLGFSFDDVQQILKTNDLDRTFV